MIKELSKINSEAELLETIEAAAHPSMGVRDYLVKIVEFWPFVRASLLFVRIWVGKRAKEKIDKFIKFMDLIIV